MKVGSTRSASWAQTDTKPSADQDAEDHKIRKSDHDHSCRHNEPREIDLADQIGVQSDYWPLRQARGKNDQGSMPAKTMSG